MALSQQPAAAAAPAHASTASSLVRELVEVIVLAVILYFGISFAVQAVHVEGLSMWATLDNNDYLIADKIDYRFHAPESASSSARASSTSTDTSSTSLICRRRGHSSTI